MAKELKIRIPDVLFDALKESAIQNNQNVNAHVIRVFTDWLNVPKLGTNWGQIRPNLGAPNLGTDPAQSGDRSGPNTPQFGDTVGDYRGNSLSPVDLEKETTLTEGGVGGTKKPKPQIDHPGFEDFWAAYPKRCFRRTRSSAVAAWNKRKPDLAVVLEALAWQDKGYADWQKTDEAGRFVYLEAPEVWLNQARWTREQPEKPKEPAVEIPTRNPYPINHPEWMKIEKLMGRSSASYNRATHPIYYGTHAIFEATGKYGGHSL